MKLLFTRFPLESALGGAEIQTISLMKGLAARGHAVAFLGSCPTLLKLCRNEGIPTVEASIGPPPVSRLTALRFLVRQGRMRWKLEKLLDSFSDLDAICMLSLSEKILLTPRAREQKINIFWIEHDHVGPWLTQSPWLSRLRELSKFVSTVTVSEMSRRLYLALGWNPERTVAIPNGIDVGRFAGAGSSATKRDGTFHIGCVARLTPEKGVDLLIDAVSQMPDAALTIIGRGREVGLLHSMVDGISQHEHVDPPRIRIVPHVDDLFAFYRSLDVFVLPSRENDPFGLVAAEAMSAGVATVVTGQCGIAGSLRDGTDALIVSAGSSDALREALVRLRDSAFRTQLSEEGRKTAEQEFSLEKMTDRYETLFQEASRSPALPD
jgi:glycosyltransferase involved in cell wall biosynthesis